MKRTFILLLTLQVQNLALAAEQERRVLLPNKAAIERVIKKFVFEGFFQETPILTELAGKTMSADEVKTTLEAAARSYFNTKDLQPAGRTHFMKHLNEIVYTLVSPKRVNIKDIDYDPPCRFCGRACSPNYYSNL
ncbi:MAG: hypothetical protein IT346_01660 [Epsilonproteobacteria bacterium]|nr:hypothetical protein [Campylobacterota bacterium]